MAQEVGTTTKYDKNSDNFAVSPALMLGHLYEAYREELYLQAVSKPSEYSKVRSEVIKTVKIGIVTKIYTDLRGVLTQCKLDGVDLIKLTGGPYCANYPPIETDSRILSLAKTLDKELDEIVNIIVPPFSDILHNRLESKAV